MSSSHHVKTHEEAKRKHESMPPQAWEPTFREPSTTNDNGRTADLRSTPSPVILNGANTFLFKPKPETQHTSKNGHWVH